MPWVRLDENAMDHPKIGGLNDGAFRLWIMGLAYCQRFLTDGYISDIALRGLRGYHVKRKVELVNAALWEPAEKGMRIHDYLQWNDSKECVLEARHFAKVRMALVRDPHLRKAIQARDGNTCRYCGGVVNWHDRKGAKGATYDHVIPDGSDELSNLVVACRACNSHKGHRTPEQAGMVLTRLSRSENLDISTYHTTPHHTTPQGYEDQKNINAFFKEREAEKIPPDAEPFDSFEPDLPVQSLLRRAGEFVERYKALHVRLRSGAHYVGKPLADFEESRQLVGVYDDKRLDKLAYVWLNTDHNFAQNGTRSIAKFRSMCSWCEEQLIAFEKQHGELNVGAA